jgi:hypothetical protein
LNLKLYIAFLLRQNGIGMLNLFKWLKRHRSRREINNVINKSATRFTVPGINPRNRHLSRFILHALAKPSSSGFDIKNPTSLLGNFLFANHDKFPKLGRMKVCLFTQTNGLNK